MMDGYGFPQPPVINETTIVNEGGGGLSLSPVTTGQLPLPSSLLTKWRRAVAYVNIPIGVGFNHIYPGGFEGFITTGQAQLLTLGDSTFHVKSASNSIGLVDYIRRNLSADMPTAEGIVWCCNNGEPRFTHGAYSLVTGGGWGNSYLLATDTGSDFTFSPGYAFDTINVYWGQTDSADYGSVSVGVDGSNLGSLNGAGSAYSWQKSTFTVAKGTHTLHISAPPAGKKFALFGVECFDSTKPAMRVIMGGVDGVGAGQFTGLAPAGWEAVNAFDLIKPDLSIIMLAKNNPGGFSTIQTSLQPIVTRAKLYGDVVLATAYPSIGIDVTLQRGVANGIIALGAANNCGVVDLFNAYSGGSGAAELENWFFGDSVHFTDVGTHDVARRMTTAIQGR